MILVTQTLVDVMLVVGKDDVWNRVTHKPPRANMIIKATFCFRGKSTAIRAGMGMIRIAISVEICILALENHRLVLFKQKPCIESSQNLATGMQLRNALITAHVP